MLSIVLMSTSPPSQLVCDFRVHVFIQVEAQPAPGQVLPPSNAHLSD